MVDKYTPLEFDNIPEEFLSSSKQVIHFKTLERQLGFIVYVSLTFTSMVPYLKGLYMTLNSWRNYRDAEGYVTKEGRQAARFGGKEPDGDPPRWVKVVPRAKSDVQALMNLTAFRDPPDIPVRAEKEEAVFIWWAMRPAQDWAQYFGCKEVK